MCQNTTMAELKTRVEELRLENDYQLRLKDMTYNEKIKELTEKFIQEMESLKTKNQAINELFDLKLTTGEGGPKTLSIQEV